MFVDEDKNGVTSNRSLDALDVRLFLLGDIRFGLKPPPLPCDADADGDGDDLWLFPPPLDD